MRVAFLALALSVAPAAAAPVGMASEVPRRPEGVVLEPARPAPAEDPDPRDASGIVTEDKPSFRQRALWVPRALLFVPKIVVWGALQPIRGAAYLYERDGGGSQRIGATTVPERTLGAYAVARYTSELGGTLGARILYKNLMGEGERLRLRVDAGGELVYGLGARITTGQRLGPLELSVDASVDLHAHDLFYGIGNGPLTEAMPASPIDPSLSDAAVESRFGQEILRHAAHADVALTDRVHVRATTAWTRRTFRREDEDDLEMRYATPALAGWSTGTNVLYAGAELALDTRRPASPQPTQTIDAAGWLVRGHAGVAHGLSGDESAYVAYGGEIQRAIRLWADTRTLALRIQVDAVAGTDGRTDGRIAFTDLPQLGGPEDLRGYPAGRFRDRAVVLASAEYAWRLINQVSAFTFVDAGEPFAAWAHATDGRLRIGFGGGVQIHTKHTFLARVQLAGSRDGDLLLGVVFSPTSGRRPREEH